MERHWHTYKWKTQGFSSVVGISITNAYLLYRFEKRAVGEEDDEQDFAEFLGQLAHCMIFNPLLPAAPTPVGLGHGTRSTTADVNNLVVPAVSMKLFLFFVTQSVVVCRVGYAARTRRRSCCQHCQVKRRATGCSLSAAVVIASAPTTVKIAVALRNERASGHSVIQLGEAVSRIMSACQARAER